MYRVHVPSQFRGSSQSCEIAEKVGSQESRNVRIDRGETVAGEFFRNSLVQRNEVFDVFAKQFFSRVRRELGCVFTLQSRENERIVQCGAADHNSRYARFRHLGGAFGVDDASVADHRYFGARNEFGEQIEMDRSSVRLACESRVKRYL